ncbi:MAG: DNA-3-methyladenine glycosylase 2 family protein [Betaproteobacteria bacterium]|jgi:DNA-3-methyladenine glycosylase II|nr:MAG: DNA-3-methyladenine glycosylase 2 family protein [Betaproteobacteria bacterium]
MSPAYWSQALTALCESDTVLETLIRQHRTRALQRRGDAFATLARSIIGQQLSVRAAQSIWQRLHQSVGSIEPGAIVSADIDELRAQGLSANKAAYLIGLAERFLDGSLDTEKWHQCEDEQVIRELTAVRGVGRWTAEMFLIFCLLRPNVLPLGDVGLQRAMRMHYSNGKPLSKLKIRRVARQWAPWCTVATWFMWRSLDAPPSP